MQKAGAMSHAFWDFIEQGHFDWPEASPEEAVYFREVAASFLRATFTLPDGYIIDVLEAQHHQSRFPVIALGWNQEPEPLHLHECKELIRRMVDPLNRFVAAVNWQEVARIRIAVMTAPGVEHLRKLLAHHAPNTPLANRCLEAIADDASNVQLAPTPWPASGIRDAQAKREPAAQSSKPLIQALTPMADAGEAVCIHSVQVDEELFFVYTDTAIERLIAIQSNLTRSHRA